MKPAPPVTRTLLTAAQPTAVSGSSLGQTAATSCVQNAQRRAPIGIWLRQCGHSRVVSSTGGSVR